MRQRILGVDDEVHMLKLLERIITEKTPYEIQVTNNSLEVPKILEEQDFDLIISDLKMPGMDGLDLLKFVKERDRREEVVIITAFGSLETAIEALAQGVFDYITKPFKKEQIIFTVDRAMRWQRTRREALELAAVYELEPYPAAQEAFAREYVRRLAARRGDGAAKIAEATGLELSRVEQWLNEE